MDIRVGEKVTGVIEEIRDEGYLVSLCNEVKGFAPEDPLLDDVKESEVNEGSEAKVRIDKKKEEGHFRVTLIKIFSKDNFQEKPDKYLKKVSHEKQNGGETKMFMQIAIGAIGIGIVLMVGYLVIAQVNTALPKDQLNDTTTDAIDSTQQTVFAGFGLIAVGIIVLAAFGLINVFK